MSRNQLLKTLSVFGHRQVVEQAVDGRSAAGAGCAEALQLFAGVAVARASGSVKTKVAHLANGDRFGFERIDDGDQVQFFAQAGDQFRIPFAAGFPCHMKRGAFGALEERAQPGEVVLGWTKTRRALKEHDSGSERFGHGERFVPSPANGRVETEMAAVFPVAFVEAGAFVGGAAGAMGDDLPGFDREFKIGRGGLAPTGGGDNFGQLIKT